MTDRQQVFADEYLKDMNAARAYRLAYPRVKSDAAARANASRLLTNANVRAYIDQQLKHLHTERTADAREVMEYLTSVLRGESQSEIVVVEGRGDGVSSAKRIQKRPDEKERLKAAELLGKRFGIFTEKLDVDADMTLEIHVEYGGDADAAEHTG